MQIFPFLRQSVRKNFIAVKDDYLKKTVIDSIREGKCMQLQAVHFDSHGHMQYIFYLYLHSLDIL